MLRFAVLSKWHVHADGYAKHVMKRSDAVITCAWDEDPARGKAWADSLGVPFEADLAACLDRKDVDAVLVDAPTNMHPEVIIAAARAGKHIFTEKVLALTTAEAQRIAAEVERANVKFCISFPHRTQPANLYLKQIVDSGLLGDVTLMRVRNAHDGASRGWLPEYWYDPQTTGGGAMMDLGAHPMYLASWLLGKPEKIQSTFAYSTGRQVEDNSVCTIEFEKGVIAVVETSLVSAMSPASTEVYGTEGAALVRGGEIAIRSSKLKGEVEGWIKPDRLPAALPHPLDMFIDGVLYGKPIEFGLKDAVALSQLMEYAYIAHREKREVSFKQ